MADPTFEAIALFIKRFRDRYFQYHSSNPPPGSSGLQRKMKIESHETLCLPFSNPPPTDVAAIHFESEDMTVLHGSPTYSFTAHALSCLFTSLQTWEIWHECLPQPVRLLIASLQLEMLTSNLTSNISSQLNALQTSKWWLFSLSYQSVNISVNKVLQITTATDPDKIFVNVTELPVLVLWVLHLNVRSGAEAVSSG